MAADMGLAAKGAVANERSPFELPGQILDCGHQLGLIAPSARNGLASRLLAIATPHMRQLSRMNQTSRLNQTKDTIEQHHAVVDASGLDVGPHFAMQQDVEPIQFAPCNRHPSPMEDSPTELESDVCPPTELDEESEGNDDSEECGLFQKVEQPMAASKKAFADDANAKATAKTTATTEIRSYESDPAFAMYAVTKRPAAAAKTPPAKRPAFDRFYPGVRLNQTPAADAIEQHQLGYEPIRPKGRIHRFNAVRLPSAQ